MTIIILQRSNKHVMGTVDGREFVCEWVEGSRDANIIGLNRPSKEQYKAILRSVFTDRTPTGGCVRYMPNDLI